MGKEKLGKLNPLGVYHKKQAFKQKLKMKEKMGVRRQLQEIQKQQQSEKLKQQQQDGQHFENQFQLPLYRKDGNIAAIDPTAIDENPDILNEFLSQFHKNNKKNKVEKEQENLNYYLEGVEFPEMEQQQECNIKQRYGEVKKIEKPINQIQQQDKIQIQQQSSSQLQQKQIVKQPQSYKSSQQSQLPQQLSQQLPQQQPQQLPQQVPQMPEFPKLPELPKELNIDEEIEEQPHLNQKIEKKVKKQIQNSFDPCLMNTFNKKQELQFLNKNQYDYYQQQYTQDEAQQIIEQQAEANEPNENYVFKKNLNATVNPVIEKEADLKIKKIDVTKEKMQFVPRCLKVKTQNQPKEFLKFLEEKILKAKEIKNILQVPISSSFFLQNQEKDKTKKLSEFLSDINNLE